MRNRSSTTLIHSQIEEKQPHDDREMAFMESIAHYANMGRAKGTEKGRHIGFYLSFIMVMTIGPKPNECYCRLGVIQTLAAYLLVGVIDAGSMLVGTATGALLGREAGILGGAAYGAAAWGLHKAKGAVHDVAAQASSISYFSLRS